MKSLFSTTTILLAPLIIATLCSCKKDAVIPANSNTYATSQTTSHSYIDESMGSFTFSRATRNNLNPNTWETFYTAQTSGSSTAFANPKTVFSFSSSSGADGPSAAGEPINTIIMDDLFSSNIGLIPNYVNHVVYDDYGNSIWFQIISLSVENSSNIQHFSGVSNVVGGTGKFAAATGSVVLNGHMGTVNFDDFYIRNEGYISY